LVYDAEVGVEAGLDSPPFPQESSGRERMKNHRRRGGKQLAAVGFVFFVESVVRSLSMSSWERRRFMLTCAKRVF
jgi:hypothetical protein